MVMVEGSASMVINRPVSEVFDAVADITRMGEWSPECTGGRWVAPATGPSVGAKFEGDNMVKLGPTPSVAAAVAPMERLFAGPVAKDVG